MVLLVVSKVPSRSAAKKRRAPSKAPSPLPLWGSASLPLRLPYAARFKHSPKGGAGRGLCLFFIQLKYECRGTNRNDRTVLQADAVLVTKYLVHVEGACA